VSVLYFVRTFLSLSRALLTASSLLADNLQWYYLLVAAFVGLFFAALTYRYFENPRHPGRISLCFLGFLIAMVWILMIVNEVVGVLLVRLFLPIPSFRIQPDSFSALTSDHRSYLRHL
jgi:hypothetical protein